MVLFTKNAAHVAEVADRVRARSSFTLTDGERTITANAPERGLWEWTVHGPEGQRKVVMQSSMELFASSADLLESLIARICE